jgi:folate-binding protein YgfZ
MGLTALQQHGEGLGATAVAEYRGATTAVRFGDPQAEFAALRDSCAVYDLGYRAKISLTGGDRVRWLNGMVTNNIRDLAAGHGVYAFLLNPQGHIVGDLYAYNLGNSITVDTDFAQVEKILATFDHYIIMDDVEVKWLGSPDEGVRGSTSIEDPTERGAADASSAGILTALGIGGPRARDIMGKAGMELPDMQPLQLHDSQCDCERGCVNCTVVRTDNPTESYEIWLAPEHVRPLWNTLIAAGALPIGSEALELHRIVSGIPRYGVDIRERDLPQETEQTRSLNFNKGCYIGQEIVERIRSRGAVHRKFSGFLAEGGVPISAGSKIVAGEKEIGEITSVASLPARKTVALGYIRREVGVPGREVFISGVKAQVVSVPVTQDVLAQEGSLARHFA